MRWRFATTPEEIAAKEAVEGRIDALWREIAERAVELARDGADETPPIAKLLASRLPAISSALEWESGPAGTGRFLTLTAGVPASRPIADACVRRAPTIPAWEIRGRRGGEDPEVGARLAVARAGGGSVDGWEVRVWREGARAQITFVTPRSARPTPELAFALAEALVGEEDVLHWVGAIDCEPVWPLQGALDLLSGRPRRRPPSELGAAVREIARSVRDRLPATPWHAAPIDAQRLEVVRFHPASPHAGARRVDSMTGASWVPGYAERVASTRFSPRAFSRCEETFAFVQIDAADFAPDTIVARRGAIEDALDEALRARGLGCSLGGATGRRFVYVDLALGELDAAIEVVCAGLRSADAPLRTWLRFPDPEMSAEWIGVHRDTPPPDDVS